MAYHGIPFGTKLKEIDPRPKWLDKQLSNYGLKVGDLVTYVNSSLSENMTIYRIINDSPPAEDAVWTEIQLSPSRSYKMRAWVYPGTKKRVTDRDLRGSIELEPVFTFFPRPGLKKKKKVSYSNLYKTKKIDLLEMAKNFANFQEFIKAEAKRSSD